MDAIEVKAFLAEAKQEVLESSRMCITINDSNVSTQSMYFSINNETLSNRITDELIREDTVSALDDTLTGADSQDSETVTEVTQKRIAEDDTVLQIKFGPNLAQSSCSTPKLEPKGLCPANSVAADKPESTDDIMPLAEVIERIQRKVVIKEPESKSDAENKENLASQVNSRKSIKQQDESTIPSKKPALRKSFIPKTSSATGSEKTSAMVPKPPAQARKSMRLSYMPTRAPRLTSRFTLTGRSTTAHLNSPKAKKLPSVARKSIAPRRMTLVSKGTEAVGTTAPRTATTRPVTTVPAKAPLSRYSTLPPPSAIPTSTVQKSSEFSCDVCKKTFHLKSTLDTHKQLHASRDRKSGLFSCTYCQKEFEKEIGLRNHVERYCTKVPVAEKRKIALANQQGNEDLVKRERTRTRTATKPSSAQTHESTTSSSGTDQSSKSQTLSPRKPIKSIVKPHSGIHYSAKKPIKCYLCKKSFPAYLDFHRHVEQVHPKTVCEPAEEADKDTV